MMEKEISVGETTRMRKTVLGRTRAAIATVARVAEEEFVEIEFI